MDGGLTFLSGLWPAVGTLPGNLWADSMSSLRSLHLQRNNITGTLPQVWFTSPDAWKGITLIDLRWNRLWGSVPTAAADSTFRPDRQRTPRLYLEPMESGTGLCGDVPLNGPTVHSSQQLLLRTGMPDGPMVVTFANSCQGGGLNSPRLYGRYCAQRLLTPRWTHEIGATCVFAHIPSLQWFPCHVWAFVFLPYDQYRLNIAHEWSLEERSSEYPLNISHEWSLKGRSSKCKVSSLVTIITVC